MFSLLIVFTLFATSDHTPFIRCRAFDSGISRINENSADASEVGHFRSEKIAKKLNARHGHFTYPNQRKAITTYLNLS